MNLLDNTEINESLALLSAIPAPKESSMDIDRAVEIARDADVDALCDGDYAPLQIGEGFTYDADSWISDHADVISCANQKDSEELRWRISSSIEWLEFMEQHSYGDVAQAMARANELTCHAQRIGLIVIQNAIKSGMTVEKLGVDE